MKALPLVAKIRGVGEITNQNLLSIGRSAAASVPDLGRVAEVEVTGALDSANEPTYLFSFLLDRSGGGESVSVGRAYVHLVQALRDGLMDRGDDHYPLIRLFTQEDWGKRKVA